MAAAPQFKIYDSTNTYIGALKDLRHAAMLVAGMGAGTSIRVGHGKKETIWMEGREDQSAAESYDHVVNIAETRLAAMNAQKERTWLTRY